MNDNQANSWFRDWVAGGRKLTEANGLNWEFPLDADGRAGHADSWNISEACDAPAIPVYRLNDLGYDGEALRVVNGRLASEDAPAIQPAPLPPFLAGFRQGRRSVAGILRPEHAFLRRAFV